MAYGINCKMSYKDAMERYRERVHFYLDDMGSETTEAEFQAEIEDGWNGWILFVGEGFVPLVIAVSGCVNCLGDAAEAFEQWARDNGREDELEENEDGETEYSLHFIEIVG